MMPILEPRLPVHLSKTEELFYELIESGNWHDANKMIGEVMEHVPLKSCKHKNIFDYASDYIVDSNRCEEQINPLLALVNKAVERKLEFRMNCAFYMNPLHIIARGKEDATTLALLKCILCNIDSIYINAYNKFGKTPLLEAISSKNTHSAMELLTHSGTDVNLSKIHNVSTCADAKRVGIVENINIKHGSSPCEAAKCLNMGEVAQAIRVHPTYKQNEVYVYPDSGDIIRYQHFLFAEQGNIDTLKVLFKTYDAETLMCVDDLYWTMLHVACFAANLPVIRFLLDKRELDRIVGSEIETNLYSEFVNRRNDVYYTALGRVLIAAGQNYDMKKEEQIRLFINCPHFSVNDVQDSRGDALIHYIAQMNDTNLMEELAKREDLIFDKENIQGQTALEIAAIEGNFEMVETLCKFASQGKDINPNRYRRKCKLVEKLKPFMEEMWFGPISIDGLSIDDLIEVYGTMEPIEIKVTYRKFLVNFSTEPTFGTDNKLELIKKHLTYYFDMVHNKAETILFDRPSWIDETLYKQIQQCLITQFGHHQFPLDKEFTLEINGVKYKMIGHPERMQQVTRPATIHYKQLCEDHLEHDRETRVEMLSGDYISLLATVVKKAQEENDHSRKESFINVIRVLVQFRKTKLNIIIKIGDKACYLDGIIKEDGIRNIIETERKNRRATVQATPCNLCVTLLEAKDHDSSLYKFVKQFVFYIESKNIERQYHHIHTDPQCRRIDSLARLFEGDGVCAAILFHGKNIYYSTNDTSTRTPNQHKIIRDTLKYFNLVIERSKNSSMDEDHSLRKVALLKFMVEAKCLRRIKSKRKRDVLSLIVEKILNKIEEFEAYVLEQNLHLDKDNALTTFSCLSAFKLCSFEIKTESYSDVFSAASYSNNANAIFRSFARYILDFKKIEDWIVHYPESDFVLALQSSNLIGDNYTCHAEMKVVQFILDRNLCIDECYIGISKLCCAHCNLILDNISQKVITRGAHGEDSKWLLPEFMKTVEGFNKIFCSDETFCKMYQDSLKESKEDTLKFIQDYAVLKDQQKIDFLYETLARGTRPQEHDWSDSDSGSEE